MQCGSVLDSGEREGDEGTVAPNPVNNKIQFHTHFPQLLDPLLGQSLKSFIFAIKSHSRKKMKNQSFDESLCSKIP